jgi:hypothetical protein
MPKHVIGIPIRIKNQSYFLIWKDIKKYFQTLIRELALLKQCKTEKLD